MPETTRASFGPQVTKPQTMVVKLRERERKNAEKKHGVKETVKQCVTRWKTIPGGGEVLSLPTTLGNPAAHRE